MCQVSSVHVLGFRAAIQNPGLLRAQGLVGGDKQVGNYNTERLCYARGKPGVFQKGLFLLDSSEFLSRFRLQAEILVWSGERKQFA